MQLWMNTKAYLSPTKMSKKCPMKSSWKRATFRGGIWYTRRLGNFPETAWLELSCPRKCKRQSTWRWNATDGTEHWKFVWSTRESSWRMMKRKLPTTAIWYSFIPATEFPRTSTLCWQKFSEPRDNCDSFCYNEWRGITEELCVSNPQSMKHRKSNTLQKVI